MALIFIFILTPTSLSHLSQGAMYHTSLAHGAPTRALKLLKISSRYLHFPWHCSRWYKSFCGGLILYLNLISPINLSYSCQGTLDHISRAPEAQIRALKPPKIPPLLQYCHQHHSCGLKPFCGGFNLNLNPLLPITLSYPVQGTVSLTYGPPRALSKP